MSYRSHLAKVAAAAVVTLAPALGAQARPTTSVPVQKTPMTTSISGGEVVDATPWTLPAAQFATDFESIMVPSNCAAVVDRADVARIAISSRLYQPGVMISPDSAKFLAACVIPGQITSGEMHQENGRTMYEVTLIPDGKTVNAKVIVDANTGQVLSSKTYGGLRGLAGYLRENVEREQNKNNAALDTLSVNPTTGRIVPPAGVACTMEARPAIQLSLLDENGMALPAGSNVRVIATTGSFSDSTTVLTNGTNSFPLSWERPGTYSIQVNVDGYAPATISDIVVGRTPDGCHVSTRQLTAQLHR